MSDIHSSAERIRSLISNAAHSAAAAGRHFNLHEVYVHALVRCGLSRDDAQDLVSGDPATDPVGRILHYAGGSHNFAVLAVTEALEAA